MVRVIGSGMTHLLLIEHLAIGYRRRTAMELDGAGRQNLQVFQDQVANLGFRNRRTHGIAPCIVADASDRDDAGEAARHLIERQAMNMRMEPVQAGRMIFRDFDPVIHRVHYDRPVLMRLWRGHAVGGIEYRYENIVPNAWVRGCRRSRRNKKTVHVQIGRVEVEIGPARISRVPELCRVDLRQLIDQSDLKCIALLQRETNAAVVGYCAGSRRTAIAARRSSADLVNPAEGIYGGASVRRRERNARDRFRLGDHQDVEHAVLACEARRLGQHGESRFFRARQTNQHAHCAEPHMEICRVGA